MPESALYTRRSIRRYTDEPLSKEDCKNVFKRFYRADKARNDRSSYGLGLSIAQSIVFDHKGEIRAESSKEGNVFTVTLSCTR